LRVFRLKEATREIADLEKKYKGSFAGVVQFERLLADSGSLRTDRINRINRDRFGAPASIWKSRVHFEGQGSRGGLRYVYEVLTVEGEELAICLTIYTKKDDDDIRIITMRIQQRFDSIVPTMAWINTIHRPDTDV